MQRTLPQFGLSVLLKSRDIPGFLVPMFVVLGFLFFTIQKQET